MTLEPDTELVVELARFPTGGLALLVIVGITLAVCLVLLTYRRDGEGMSPRRRYILTALRGTAVCFACVVLLEPTVVATRRDIRPGQSLVLIDVSQSMGHRDAYRRDEVAPLREAWHRLGVVNLTEITRLDLAKRLLAQDDYRLLRRLAVRNDVRIYGFGAGLDLLATVPLAQTMASGSSPHRDFLEPVQPAGRYSNLGGALRTALEQSQGASIAGVVLISDGRRNLGPLGPEIARLLRQRRIPRTIVVPIGDSSATRTLRLSRVDAPEKVFQRDPFAMEASLESQGYDELVVDVRLVRQHADAGTFESETVRTAHVRIGGDRTEARVRFDDLRADAPGIHTYTIEVEPPLEPKNPDRHILRKQIDVLGEQTRVLLIAGGPSHEYRILRALLTRDQTIQLACWLTSADQGFSQDGNIHLDALPRERDALEEFDIFVLMDPDSRKLDIEFCNLVSEQVTENGAGLWWVCGEKFTLDAIRETAPTHSLVELLPVVLDLQEADENLGLARGMPQSWRYSLTPEGETHRATRLADDRVSNSSLWARLPGFHFAFPVVRGKPAAQILVTHTKPTTRDSGPRPMIASHFIGSGRAMFTGTDDTYRWRQTLEPAYDRFWIKGIRYLFEGRLRAGNSRLRIDLSDDKIELGQALNMVVNARTEAFEPLVSSNYNLELAGENQTPETLRLEPVEGMPGQYSAYVRPIRTGYYTLRSAHQPGKRQVEVSFQVTPAAIEKEGPTDLAELGAIASTPGGILVPTPDALFDAVDSIASGTKIESFTSSRSIWDSWATVTVLITVLAAEWWLRKRANLT